jgi:hypothetical protein
MCEGNGKCLTECECYDSFIYKEQNISIVHVIKKNIICITKQNIAK